MNSRSFDKPYYRPLEPVVVTVSITPDLSVKAYGVEDHFPLTWAVNGADNGGSSFPGVVKFGVFFDSNPRDFHYTLTPPLGEKAEAVFQGQASFDGVSQPIQGPDLKFDYVAPHAPQ